MASEDEYRAEYEDFTDGENLEYFEGFMTIYEEAGLPDDLDTFYEFLNTFYPDTESHDKAFWDDLRERFYEMTGATDQNIDWALWREIIEHISPGGAK